MSETTARLFRHSAWASQRMYEAVTQLPLAAEVAGYDEAIASQASQPDEYLTITEGDKSWQNLRSTILAEAIYHAAEHRTQLVDALEARGFTTISLDSLDLWVFENWEKKNKG